MSKPSYQNTLFDLFDRRPARRRGALVLDALPEVEEPGTRELAEELHVSLEETLGVVDLVFTDNRRRMVSIRSKRKRFEVRIHHMFLGADETIVDAIAGLARTREAEDSRRLIREYIRQNRDAITFERNPDVLTQKGGTHDLEPLMRDALAHFADHEALQDIAITWGRAGFGRRSIRFGSFDFDLRLIRIHPALDADWVPDFFVEFVIYHELLHAVVPPVVSPGGRRDLHPPEFRERERQFPRYEEAMAWESKNLRRLLGRR